jgi:HPt (histidine-containing phosphotransfer) domain-containing protein
VEGFVGRLRERVREMRQAATKREFAELAELAHWLKGAAGSMGFGPLTTPAAALQSNAQAGNVDAIAMNLQAIEDITSRIQVRSQTPCGSPSC